jgi:protein TonB
MRYVIAIGLAGGVTFGLFFLMHTLIAFGAQKEIVDKGGRVVIDFVRLKRQVEPPIEERKLPAKNLPRAQPPPPPPLALPRVNKPNTRALRVASVPVPEAPRQQVKLLGGPTLGGAGPSDADTIPLVRVQPLYPPAAAERRIEGWVKLRFTIGTTGAVKKPQVIDADPGGIFDRAAIQAIRKWKYKPRIENGVPVETRGAKVKLSFKLEDL